MGGNLRKKIPVFGMDLNKLPNFLNFLKKIGLIVLQIFNLFVYYVICSLFGGETDDKLKRRTWNVRTEKKRASN